MSLYLEYTGSGSGKRYTIASKIKVVEAIKSGASMNSITVATGVAGVTLAQWVGDYNMGKYTLENTTQVVRKPKTSLQVALETARKYATEATDKVKRIEDAIAVLEAEGIKVA